jgi:hypothetical protein
MKSNLTAKEDAFRPNFDVKRPSYFRPIFHDFVAMMEKCLVQHDREPTSRARLDAEIACGPLVDERAQIRRRSSFRD